jgi:hypothetical protein
MPVARLHGVALIGTAMLILSGSAYAAHPLVSEDTGTQGTGGNQIELNSDWSRGGGERTNTAAFTYTRGVAEAVDIFINAPTTWKSPTGQSTGLNDVSLGAKWRFFENGGFSLGIKPEWIAATGDEDKALGNGKDSYALTLMAQVETDDVTWLFNYGTTRQQFKLLADSLANRKAVDRVSAAMLYGVTDTVTLLVDVGQSDPETKLDTAKPKFMVLGAIYAVGDDLDLDVGYKKGLNSAEPNKQWGVGLTWRFK